MCNQHHLEEELWKGCGCLRSALSCDDDYFKQFNEMFLWCKVFTDNLASVVLFCSFDSNIILSWWVRPAVKDEGRTHLFVVSFVCLSHFPLQTLVTGHTRR